MLCQLSYARSDAQLIERCDGLPDYFNGMLQLLQLGVAVFVGTSMADKCLTGLQLIERLKRIPQF